MSLRARILLVVILASVIPLGLVGLWLTDSARRSGEDLLRARLTAALDEAVSLVTSQYIQHRSSLLFVGEDAEVQRLLGSPNSNRGAVTWEDGGDVLDLAPRFPDLDPGVHRIEVRDTAGRAVARREPTPHAGGDRAGPALTLEFPVFDRANGAVLGSMSATLDPELLLPPDRLPSTAAGTILTLTDEAGRALTPVPLVLPGREDDRFVWAGEDWTVLRQSLDEPAVTLVAAATLGPALGPFRQSARQGTLVLVGVALLAVVSTTYLTRRLTRSLDDLSRAATALAAGELDRRVPVETDDEIGRVAQAFNHMAERLRRTLDRIAGREALAAVGEFAAGLAHEVRNPLTAVQINLQFVESELPPDSPLLEPQRKALAEIRRLDATVRDALRVARSGAVETRSVDLRAPLRAAVEVARPTFEARQATVFGETPGTPVLVRGDPGALEQLFLNLLQNAGQSLRPGGRATARIDTDGDDAVVRIEDDGPGMPPEVVERVFEPLFSTRPEGTGLGLPIAQRIARAHDGLLRIHTQEGKGTTVEVRLPRSAPVASAEHTA